jgi:hypothetical protein
MLKAVFPMLPVQRLSSEDHRGKNIKTDIKEIGLRMQTELLKSFGSEKKNCGFLLMWQYGNDGNNGFRKRQQTY